MAAGQGFKTFTTGEVLTAGDVNGYLMQGINVFASTAARDAAITAPAEGQFAFTKDTNGLWYYDGAAWVASGATGDIEGVTAGVGISGGGTSGTVTITNSMATAIDAKGDLVAGTGADTFSRLAVGSNNTVLTADSGETTGLKWATVSTAKNFSLLGSANLTGAATITISGISGIDELRIFIQGGSSSGAEPSMNLRLNADNGNNYSFFSGFQTGSTSSFSSTASTSSYTFGRMSDNAASVGYASVTVSGCNTSGIKLLTHGSGASAAGGTGNGVNTGGGLWNNSATVTSASVIVSAGNWDAGTVYIYGSA